MFHVYSSSSWPPWPALAFLRSFPFGQTNVCPSERVIVPLITSGRWHLFVALTQENWHRNQCRIYNTRFLEVESQQRNLWKAVEHLQQIMERRNSQLWQRNVTFHQPQTSAHSSQPSHDLNRDPTFELIVRSPTPVSLPPPPPVPTNTPDPEHNPQSTSRHPLRATDTRPASLRRSYTTSTLRQRTW